MSEPSISPVPELARPKQNGPRLSEDDIVVPTIESDSDRTSNATEPAPHNTHGWIAGLSMAVVTAGILLGGFGSWSGGSDESQHPNWQHVQAATDASTTDANLLTKVASNEPISISASIEVSAADIDRSATRKIRSALQRNDITAATIALQAAQRTSSPETGVVLPDLHDDPNLALALEQGRKELFQIELFDCCQEDGDVVAIVVNGSPFATVPIMNAGTLLSVPLSSGENTITIQGTQDGRGGVTLSFRTSRGDFFAGRMRVGEAYQLGVTVQ